MRKIIVFVLVVAVAFLAYQQYGPKKPEFREIRNMQFEELSNKKVIVVADAMIYNPNITSIEVTDINLDVSVDGSKAGKAVGKEKSIIGEAGQEFAVPIRATFETADFLKSGGGLLGGLAGLLGKKKFQIDYEGNITLKVLFVNFDVPVKETTSLGK